MNSWPVLMRRARNWWFHYLQSNKRERHVAAGCLPFAASTYREPAVKERAADKFMRTLQLSSNYESKRSNVFNVAPSINISAMTIPFPFSVSTELLYPVKRFRKLLVCLPLFGLQKWLTVSSKCLTRAFAVCTKPTVDSVNLAILYIFAKKSRKTVLLLSSRTWRHRSFPRLRKATVGRSPMTLWQALHSEQLHQRRLHRSRVLGRMTRTGTVAAFNHNNIILLYFSLSCSIV